MTKQQYLIKILADSLHETSLDAQRYHDEPDGSDFLAKSIIDLMAIVQIVGNEGLLTEITPQEFESLCKAKTQAVDDELDKLMTEGVVQDEQPATD